MDTLKISSSSFVDNGQIPVTYTCDGENVNPPLEIKDIPDGTKSLVLIVDDPDAPRGVWVHWIVWNIPNSGGIDENSVPGVEGVNDFGKHSYGGPCPPSGTHRYFFKVYALDAELSISPKSHKGDVENAMRGHILAEGRLMGKYTRQR